MRGAEGGGGGAGDVDGSGSRGGGGDAEESNSAGIKRRPELRSLFDRPHRLSKPFIS
jgi:hypothetical protein